MSTGDDERTAVPQKVEGTVVRREEVPSTQEPSAGKEYGLGALKGLIGAVPYAGTLLNEVLFEARSRLKQERLNAFFVGVADDVRLLGETKLDTSFIGTDDFSDLIEDICQRVMRAGVEANRNRFRKVLVDAMQGKASPTFEAIFIDILGEISEAELDVLSGFIWAHTQQKELWREGRKAEIAPMDYAQEKIKGFDSRDFKLMVQSLIRKGLMFDDSYGRMDAVPFVFIAATDLGAEFYVWLTK